MEADVEVVAVAEVVVVVEGEEMVEVAGMEVEVEVVQFLSALPESKISRAILVLNLHLFTSMCGWCMLLKDQPCSSSYTALSTLRMSGQPSATTASKKSELVQEVINITELAIHSTMLCWHRRRGRRRGWRGWRWRWRRWRRCKQESSNARRSRESTS